VAASGWTGAYYVDADHISLKTVDAFIPGSDYFTLDVADFTGMAAEAGAIVGRNVTDNLFYRHLQPIFAPAFGTSNTPSSSRFAKSLGSIVAGSR
jgi:hypothetical protein